MSPASPEPADSETPLLLAYLTEFYRHNETNEYHNRVLEGLRQAAEEENCSLFHLSYAHNPSPGMINNDLERMLGVMSQGGFDGVIVMGFCEAGSDQGLERVQKAAGCPVLCMGRHLESRPSVFFDGSAYLEEVLEHLYTVHGRRTIIFVPPYHQDSRKDLFQDFMESRGIWDPRLILPEQVIRDYRGRDRYGPELAHEVTAYLAASGIRADGVVCTTGREAVCIQEALAKEGRRPGIDVSLVSCEDGLRCRSADPSLTAIEFPWQNLAWQSLKSLAALARNGTAPPQDHVPGSIKYRRSCGCDSPFLALAAEVRKRGLSGRDAIKMVKDKFPHVGFDMVGLWEKLMGAAENGNTQPVMVMLEDICRHARSEQLLFEVESFMLMVQASLMDKAVDPEGMERLLVRVRTMIRERTENFLERRSLDARILSSRIQRLGQDLITTFDKNQLRILLRQRLAGLDVQQVHILVPPSGRPPSSPTESSLSAQHEPWNLEVFFSTRLQTPPDLAQGSCPGLSHIFSGLLCEPRKRSLILMQALGSDDEYLGMVAYEPGFLDGFLYNALSDQLSTAYKCVSLVENLVASQKALQASQHQIELMNWNLEDRIFRRTQELSQANQELSQTITELKNTQDRLVHSEKMAALARLMSAIAHELNTPLGVVISAVTYLEALGQGLDAKFKAQTMSRNDLAGFLDKMSEASRLMQLNVTKTNALVNHFKALSLSQSRSEHRPLRLKLFLEACLFDIQARHPDGHVDYRVECPENLEVESYPEILTQVLENLVHWSQDLPETLEPKLELTVNRIPGWVSLRYHDLRRPRLDIPEEGVFDPGIGVSSEENATGLELNIVWNTVMQLLEGTIVLDTSVLQGNCFEIRLPDLDGLRIPE